MLINKKTGSICMALVAIMLLTACHPKVAPSSDMDKQLSCAELQQEIQRVQDVKAKIDKSRGFSMRNVGLGLFFWPGVIINEVTGETAENEANAKLVALQNIYAKKQCSRESVDLAQSTNKNVKKNNATSKKG